LPVGIFEGLDQVFVCAVNPPSKGFPEHFGEFDEADCIGHLT